jgi:hypothetical protein
VVCALVVERWWRQWEKDGAYAAARLAFNTFMIAVVIQFVMVSNLALMLIETSPVLMPAFTAVAIGVLGRYRGLRLTEIGRFAPIWLERRRLARESEDEGEDETVPIAEPVVAIDRTMPEEEFLAAWERAPPLEGVWVIESAADFDPSRRRRVPQPRCDAGVHDAPRLNASGRPMKHNAWIIRSPEDV